jgi:hypothetical protein
MSCSSLARAITVVVCVLGCDAFGTVAAASASTSAIAPFGGEGEAAGQFSGPRGIAVDQESGDVYIGDRENKRVDKFGSKGEFLLAWGWGVTDGAAEPQSCGPEGTSGTCRSGIEGTGSGQFGELSMGVAVDNNPLDASRGDVYVEDGTNHRIEKFGPEGKFLLMFGGEVNQKTKGFVCFAGEECKAGVEGAGPGEFEELLSGTIAVDTAGTVFVADNGRVQEFDEGGTFVKEISLPSSGNIYALTVGGGEEVYVVSELLSGVREYDGSGVEVGERDPAVSFSGTGVAIGPSLELYVFNAESGHVREYAKSGAQIASFAEHDAASPGEFTRGIAFGAGVGGLYVLYGATVQFAVPPPPGPVVLSASVSAILSTTATFAAVLNAEGHETSYRFEYGATQAYGSSTAAEVLPGGAGFEDEPVITHITGLQPQTGYHLRVVATNECEPVEEPGRMCTVDGPDQTFETLPPVSIDSESVSHTTATSARLETELNPHDLATEFQFEYLTQAEFDENGESWIGPDKPVAAPHPDGEVGEGTTDVPENLLIEGLTPSTTYHYRLVARNSAGVVQGPDRVFATRSGGSARLIDGRAWEMVSPPDKRGSGLEAMTKEGGIIQAAQDGSGLAYIAKAPIDAEPAGSRSFADTQLLATRAGGVWNTQDIATPHETVAGLVGGRLSEYRMFSPDLSVGLVEPEGQTPLSAEATEPTPYLRHETSCQADPSACYEPLVTGCPAPPAPCEPLIQEHADVPAGTKFGTVYEGGVRNASTGVEFAGATPDLSHVVLVAPESLTLGFEAGTGREDALYEWIGGALTPVSIVPDGTSAAAEGGAKLGAKGLDVRNAISSDGTRVFFESEQSHLFLRDTAEAETAQLDAPQEGAPGGISHALFQGANDDGTKAFFTDPAQLTTDATSNASAPDLYMCEVGEAAGKPTCALKDLTVDAHPGEAADVLGRVLGSGSEGNFVYFVANGELAQGATHGGCKTHSPQSPELTCNLYVYDASAKQTRLVAVLSGADAPDWEAGDEGANLGELTDRVSENGRYLAFMSRRSLTGYDNRDAVSGEPDEEVYLYDAQSGRLVCASCDPTGARPVGVFDSETLLSPLLVDRTAVWKGQTLAGSIPGWTSVEKIRALYQSRYLNDEGRLFINSPVGLVSQDSNGVEDVYEYEPEGTGPAAARCGPEAGGGIEAFKAGMAVEVEGRQVEEGPGCVGLISSGTSSEESAFLDASAMGPGGEEGEDVFFLTTARLSSADTDSALDVYDAHVCTAASPCPSVQANTPPPCTATEACRATGASQQTANIPPSATLTGAGNAQPSVTTTKPKTAAQVRAERLTKALKACRVKRNERRRHACEVQARKRYGPIRSGEKPGKASRRHTRRSK